MFKQFKFALIKIVIKTIGQTSDGIRICFQHGLTSGKMLDYIYRNQPSGRWFIGKVIDRTFLNNSGWEAVRIRRKHLEKLMIDAIEELRKDDRPVSLLDIASGPAAYILSVLEKVRESDVFARCRDFDERWIREGQNEAIRRNLKNVHFEQGDAFDRSTILSLIPKPNLIVLSGFYDWINDDEKVKESFQILYDTLEPEGYFVLSNQSAHPNLEFAEAVFFDFNHKPLRMTMRSKETICKWLEEAGLEVQKTLCDTNGYYSVIKARKPGK